MLVSPKIPVARYARGCLYLISSRVHEEWPNEGGGWGRGLLIDMPA